MIAATVVLHALLMLKASDANRIIIETPKPVEPAYVLPIDRPAYFKYTSKAYLSASVRVMLRGLPHSIYVDSAVPDIQELLTAVIPYAQLVVHGR